MNLYRSSPSLVEWDSNEARCANQFRGKLAFLSLAPFGFELKKLFETKFFIDRLLDWIECRGIVGEMLLGLEK